MPKIKYRVCLSPEERDRLQLILDGGQLVGRLTMHAQVLLLADECRHGSKMSEQAIAARLDINSQTVHSIRRRYAQEGFEAALQRKSRHQSTIHTRITTDVRTRIIALSQTQPPIGRSRWTLRLLAHHAQELQIIDRISHETVGQLLKNAVQQGIL